MNRKWVDQSKKVLMPNHAHTNVHKLRYTANVKCEFFRLFMYTFK